MFVFSLTLSGSNVQRNETPLQAAHRYRHHSVVNLLSDFIGSTAPWKPDGTCTPPDEGTDLIQQDVEMAMEICEELV